MILLDPLKIDTVRLSDEGDALVIIDQTLLPNEVKYLSLTRTEDIWEAIRALRVRGAPAIGVAAAFGAYLAAFYAPDAELEARFLAALRLSCDLPAHGGEPLLGARQDAPRLRRAAGQGSGDVRAALRAEAQAIMDEDIEISRSIGKYGLELLRPGMGILTHCNAGTLATAKYGTALAPSTPPSTMASPASASTATRPGPSSRARASPPSRWSPPASTPPSSATTWPPRS